MEKGIKVPIKKGENCPNINWKSKLSEEKKSHS